MLALLMFLVSQIPSVDGIPNEWGPWNTLERIDLVEDSGDAYGLLGYDLINLHAAYGPAGDSLYFAIFVDSAISSVYYWTQFIVNGVDTYYVRNGAATIPGTWAFSTQYNFLEYGISLVDLGYPIGGIDVQFRFFTTLDEYGILIIDWAPDNIDTAFTLIIPTRVKELKPSRKKTNKKVVIKNGKIYRTVVLPTYNKEVLVDITGRIIK